MSNALSEGSVATLDAIASILLRCFIITVGAMIFTWSVVFMLGDVIYSIHSQLYEITRKEFDLLLPLHDDVLEGLEYPFLWHSFCGDQVVPQGKTIVILPGRSTDVAEVDSWIKVNISRQALSLFRSLEPSSRRQAQRPAYPFGQVPGRVRLAPA